MDKLIAVAVFDAAVGAFNRPFFVPAIGLAVRSFTDEVNRMEAGNTMCAHPADFTLFRLGTYSELTGRFESLDLPERLCLASDVLVKE